MAAKPAVSSPPPFHFNGLTITLHPDVYEPAEDTFQLLETLAITPKDTILELGTGCGIISLECARQGCTVVCTDLNPYAVELTKENIKQNQHLLKGTIEVHYGNLFEPIKKHERFTIIIFNPPYLPTKPFERIGGNGWIDLATDGGKNGLSTTKRFIKEIPNHLQKNGYATFIYSSLADRTTLTKSLIATKVHAEIVSTRHFNDETLEVYRVTLP